MFSLAATLSALKAVPKTIWAALALVLGLSAFWFIAERDGSAREKARGATRIEAANEAADAKNARAANQAALSRRRDEDEINNQQEAERNAVAPIPDARPSQRQFALACEQLRSQPDGRQAADAAGCGPSR